MMHKIEGEHLRDLVNAYLQSRDFERVTASQDQYKYWLEVVMNMKLNRKSVGALKFKGMTTPFCQEIYDLLCDRGVTFANRICAVIRKVFSFGLKYGLCDHNPWSSVQKLTVQPRRTMWQKEDVVLFLNTAYSKFETRSVGLICHMAYDWAQRIGDMRLLTWDQIDLVGQVLHLEQSKRRAIVHLPVSDYLTEMLTQQQKDFGFQQYIAPNVKAKASDGYHPYSVYNISRAANRIKKLAGLNEDLRLSDLRRTATTEMVEAGVGILQLMQVTGHQNPQSVKPYLKNTLTGASYALKLRNAHTAGGTYNV